MADKFAAVYLTESDATLLKKLLQQIRKEPIPQTRSKPPHHFREMETYLAKPATSDGVPAIVYEGEGYNDITGMAMCDLYTIHMVDGESEIVDLKMQRYVHNVAPSIIAQGTYFPISRHNCGEWLALIGYWMVTPQVANIRRFELKYALAPGGSATAYVLPYEDGGYDDPDVNDEFEVYDAFGCFRGRGNNVYPIPHHNGSRGYAIYRSDSEHWEIVWMVPNALLLRGQLPASTSGSSGDLPGSAWFTLESAEVIQPTGGIIVDHDPAGEFTVMNPFTLAGIETDKVLVAWDTRESPDAWSLIQVQHHELEVVTDYRVDGANLKLQKKVKTIHTMFEDDDTQTWIDVHTGTTCT